MGYQLRQLLHLGGFRREGGPTIPRFTPAAAYKTGLQIVQSLHRKPFVHSMCVCPHLGPTRHMHVYVYR